MEYSTKEDEIKDDLKDLGSRYKNMTTKQLADEAVQIATKQIIASWEFKKPRLAKINKYYDLYDGKVAKKLRQLFNVPIPVFPGMIDTLNAQYDTPVTMTFKEGTPADYFKVNKINGAFQMEIMNTAHTSKWDSKLRMARKHAIMSGRGILEYNVTSDPEYSSELDNVLLKNFNFQPKGGLYLENHLFAGREDIEKTKSELLAGAKFGIYDKEQVKLLISRCSDSEYLPSTNIDESLKLSRFKAMGVNPDNHSYVGQEVYKLANHILEIDGTRYYLCFHPWSKTWLTFKKWKEISTSELYPWATFATHEDDENFLSKSFADDMYLASDAIVAMFNQELTNREKRNFGARAYDKDMFTDVRKLDEAMHRPDALVPADTKGGTRRISEGVYEFKVGELNGTVNLIDWITNSLGRNTGANDLAMGAVQEVSKKASVTFAEQKSISKRLSWSAQPFQDMMADLGKKYIFGLKDHMPSKMAIRVLGEGGWDWQEITRLDLDIKKDVDVMIRSSDKQAQESEINAKRRTEALNLLMASPNINPKKRDEEILKSVGGYSENEIAEFMDVKTFNDRKAIAKASESIEMILRDEKPLVWYGANRAFIKKIINYARDNQVTLKEKAPILIQYAQQHEQIAMENMNAEMMEDQISMQQTQMMNRQAQGMSAESKAENPGMSGGMSRAMSVGNSV
jgi:hypothetical protein